MHSHVRTRGYVFLSTPKGGALTVQCICRYVWLWLYEWFIAVASRLLRARVSCCCLVSIEVGKVPWRWTVSVNADHSDLAWVLNHPKPDSRFVGWTIKLKDIWVPCDLPERSMQWSGRSFVTCPWTGFNTTVDGVSSGARTINGHVLMLWHT